MPKILYISNIAGKKLSLSFLGSAIYAAKELGYEFHAVANRSASSEEQTKSDEEEFGIKLHHIDLVRAPYSLRNVKAYKQLCKLIHDEQIEYIHCNTPIGGILGRVAGKKCKVKKVIYQAHGFHFYKGAPLLNWMLYYPIERWLAHYTDALITINQEDYKLAKNKFHLRNKGQVYYVPGVGIDLTQYDNKVSDGLRKSLGIDDDDVMLISAGDLVERKNYKLAIEAIAKSNLKSIKYCICGKGSQYKELSAYTKSLGVDSQILFLGYRSDMKELFKVADIFLLTTKQEGLPRSMMEAMASGLPCIASKVRGNTDLLEDGKGGFLCDIDNAQAFADAIKKLVKNPDMRKEFGIENLKHIMKFDILKILDKMQEIYTTEFDSLCNMGVSKFNLTSFYPIRVCKRLELGLSLDDVVLISAGRLDINKNNATTIRAVAKVPGVKLLLCGDGDQKEKLQILAKTLGVSERVLFLGNRSDIKELYQVADIFVMMSFREGLSRSLMEAMASGLPCIVSKIRGNVDLIEDGVGGYNVMPMDDEVLSEKIRYLARQHDIRKRMYVFNEAKINNFSQNVVIKQLKHIYETIFTVSV